MIHCESGRAISVTYILLTVIIVL